MMLSFLVSVTLLYINDYSCIGFVVDCTETPYMCSETNIPANIPCMEDEDCFIACNEEQSCMSSTIICPINGDCNIECDGWQSCKNIIINSQHSLSGNLNISCAASTDHCYGMKILGSTKKTYSGDMNVLCNGELQSCMNSIIQCPLIGNCLISCNADNSCKYSNITGPNNGDLNINCNAERSCVGAIFNGKQSNHMEINGCVAMESCLNLSIYCPPNTNQSANCLMQGNDHIGWLEIYAINGWYDMQIDFSGDFDINHGGKMYCGNDYDFQCNIAAMEWKCDNENDICNKMNNIFDLNEITSTEILLNNDRVTNVTLPDLSNDFEHGSMGMVIIGAGLITVAIGCILCGVFKHLFTKRKVKKKKKIQSKVYMGAKEKTRSSSNNQHVGPIIVGEEPSFEDSNGIIHHQHSNHERKISNLHDHNKHKR